MQYAGFWKRVAAYVIDTIILYIVSALAGGLVGGVVGFLYAATTGTTEGLEELAFGLGFILGIVIGWLYFALQESSPQQATLGKRAMGIVVTDLQGKRISFGKASGRYFGKIISSFILLIGFIMVAFTEKKQGLHDMMAGTLVFKRS